EGERAIELGRQLRKRAVAASCTRWSALGDDEAASEGCQLVTSRTLELRAVTRCRKGCSHVAYHGGGETAQRNVAGARPEQPTRQHRDAAANHPADDARCYGLHRGNAGDR